MEQRVKEIVAECRRQEESCLYTSTALFQWVKEVKVYRVLFITAPIVLGAFASARFFVKNPDFDLLTAIFSLLAGLFPAIFKALDLDVSIKAISDSATRFKNLQDRFRQAALIGPTGKLDELEDDFKQLMEKMEDARQANLAIPDRHFKKSQTIIAKGDYRFTVDATTDPAHKQN
ncbi:hypothetical protein D3C87_1075440 [compost metagenome]|uniref:hypothetical protein n=1 Tax=Variovorax boronicumulans TaxID=436515 RepID=UPI000BB3DDA7|nr:hypothetical protein [Variovorax boronicumulans]PBI95727.1 hypothetical protein BKP43_00350 [Variovorax boronicumulans]